MMSIRLQIKWNTFSLLFSKLCVLVMERTYRSTNAMRLANNVQGSRLKETKSREHFTSETLKTSLKTKISFQNF